MVMHIIVSMRVLSLEREAGKMTVHAMHAVRAEPARSRHHAAVTASASAASASEGFAARVNGAQKRSGCSCENKNDFCTHWVCPNVGAIGRVLNGGTSRALKANHKTAVS